MEPPPPLNTHQLRQKLLALLTSCGLACFFFPVSFILLFLLILVSLFSSQSTNLNGHNHLLIPIIILIYLFSLISSGGWWFFYFFFLGWTAGTSARASAQTHRCIVCAASSPYSQNCHDLETLTPISELPLYYTSVQSNEKQFNSSAVNVFFAGCIGYCWVQYFRHPCLNTKGNTILETPQDNDTLFAGCVGFLPTSIG